MRFKKRERKQNYKVFSGTYFTVFNFGKKMAYAVSRETIKTYCNIDAYFFNPSKSCF